MNEEKIKQKLTENKLETYIPIFEKNHLLDENILATMTDEDYLSIGITILGDRKKLILLFKSNTKNSSKKNSSEENLSDFYTNEEKFVNISRNGKLYCFKPSEPNKLYCRKCHYKVTEDATICSNCNNNLVDSVTHSKQEEPITTSLCEDKDNLSHDYAKSTTSKKHKFSKFIFLIIFATFIGVISYTCTMSLNDMNNNHNNSSNAKNKKTLSGVTINRDIYQLVITTNQSLHDVRLRVNGNYVYKVNSLTEGTYTVGLATFSDSHGNIFNPFTTSLRSVSIFCKEGSAYFQP